MQAASHPDEKGIPCQEPLIFNIRMQTTSCDHSRAGSDCKQGWSCTSSWHSAQSNQISLPWLTVLEVVVKATPNLLAYKKSRCNGDFSFKVMVGNCQSCFSLRPRTSNFLCKLGTLKFLNRTEHIDQIDRQRERAMRQKETDRQRERERHTHTLFRYGEKRGRH